MFLVFLMFLHQNLQSINPLPVVMWYLSKGTIQHLYTEIQESKLIGQTEKMV